jgi:RNase P/RNase MRP subunit p29
MREREVWGQKLEKRARVKIVSLIGFQAKVKSISSGSIIIGRIVDETRNTILIRSSDGSIKRFPKNAVSITIMMGDNNICVEDGSLILGTPAERIKRPYHRWAKPR